MKTKVGVIAIAITIVFGLLLLSTGDKITGVFLADYTISEDGSVMKLKVGVASSMGYIRMMKTRDEGNKKYITFYSTFGLNSSMGAKDEYQIKLEPTCDEIYFFSGDDEYKVILQKNNETDEWVRVKQ